MNNSLAQKWLDQDKGKKEIEREVNNLRNLIIDTIELNYKDGVDGTLLSVVLSDLVCDAQIDANVSKDKFLKNIAMIYDNCVLIRRISDENVE